MLLKKGIILSLLLLVSSQSYGARYFDGVQAQSMCQSDQIEMIAGCSMFIIGTAEAFRMMGFSEDKYCFADQIDNYHLRQQFLVFLNQNPESLNYSATSLLLGSFVQNNPCQSKESPKN